MGTDGDGYNFCGNGWGWLDFPLPCRSLISNTRVQTVGPYNLTLSRPVIKQTGRDEPS